MPLSMQEYDFKNVKCLSFSLPTSDSLSDDIASSKCQMKRGRRKPQGTVEYTVSAAPLPHTLSETLHHSLSSGH